jgi:hypothetical protein
MPRGGNRKERRNQMASKQATKRLKKSKKLEKTDAPIIFVVGKRR